MQKNESGWYLKHRDGVEHGPFLLADLVGAAAAGNIADDTFVKHAVHSRHQWVIAKRISPIAQAATKGNVAPSQADPNAASTQKREPAGAHEASGQGAPSGQDAAAQAAQSPTHATGQPPQKTASELNAGGATRGGQTTDRPTVAAHPSPTTGQPSKTQSPASTHGAQPRASQGFRREQPEPSKTSAKSNVAESSNSGFTSGTQAASSTGRRSVFRRAEGMDASHRDATERRGEVTKPLSHEERSENTASLSAPMIRDTREKPFPVPKTFVDALLALFDFRFRSFITPWIVKIVWVICVAAAMLSVVKLGYDMFVEPAVGETVTSSASPGWQFDPLAGQTLWQSALVRFFLAVLGIGMLLIAVRVVCEGAIVFFHVANSVSDLKQLAQQREKQ